MSVTSFLDDALGIETKKKSTPTVTSILGNATSTVKAAPRVLTPESPAPEVPGTPPASSKQTTPTQRNKRKRKDPLLDAADPLNTYATEVTGA